MTKEPILSEIPKCTAEGCWHGVIVDNDKAVGLCPECSGTGVAVPDLVETYKMFCKPCGITDYVAMPHSTRVDKNRCLECHQFYTSWEAVLLKRTKQGDKQ